MARREQAAVLATDQRPVKHQQCRGAETAGDSSEAIWIQKERRESAHKAIACPQVPRPLPRPAQDNQLLFQ